MSKPKEHGCDIATLIFRNLDVEDIEKTLRIELFGACFVNCKKNVAATTIAL